eukprot:7002783-Prymnesium_polylepis.1
MTRDTTRAASPAASGWTSLGARGGRLSRGTTGTISPELLGEKATAVEGTSRLKWIAPRPRRSSSAARLERVRASVASPGGKRKRRPPIRRRL